MITLESSQNVVRLPSPQENRVDMARLERAVREILIALGEDPGREGLMETPSRVARAYAELLGGLRDDPQRHLARVFVHESAGDDLVVVRDIEFSSMCEHHLLPFTGTAHVVYLPEGGKVVGLSKVARTVDVLAKRPQMQERLTSLIADAISEHLGARGVGVVVRGEHMCMRLRGASKQKADTVTTAFRGVLQERDALRSEALALLGARCGM